jgi:hypothetical protein
MEQASQAALGEPDPQYLSLQTKCSLQPLHDVTSWLEMCPFK